MVLLQIPDHNRKQTLHKATFIFLAENMGKSCQHVRHKPVITAHIQSPEYAVFIQGSATSVSSRLR
jgi:hypothetical protein